MLIVSVVPPSSRDVARRASAFPPDAARKRLRHLASQLGALFFGAFRGLRVGVIFSQHSEFIIGRPEIARYSPRSRNLLTVESRADLRERLHDDGGARSGGQALPFFVGLAQVL